MSGAQSISTNKRHKKNTFIPLSILQPNIFHFELLINLSLKVELTDVKCI